MNISIFAQPPYVIRHLQRVSTIIRGEQIACYLQNARLNPSKNYENDICIYVKPNVKPESNFKFEGKPYLDILDGFNLYHLLNKYADVPVIVFSELDVETMSRYVKNKIILIPHHHVNFERVQRKKNKIVKIGVAGSIGAFDYIPDEIKHGIAKRNMELIEFSTFFPRTSVTKFYESLDINLVWRPYKKDLSNPFKIVNAGAFGVPSICLDEPAFKEVKDCYVPVSSVKECLEKIDELKNDNSLYEHYANKCLKKMEEYHIENIAKLYEALT